MTIEPAIVSFARWCADRGAPVGSREFDYDRLWRWSVNETAEFWDAVRQFFDVSLDGPATTVLSGDMPRARWFEGTRLNYVDQVLRHAADETPALIDLAQSGDGTGLVDRTLTRRELAAQVASFAATLRGFGVVPGDRVVGYLPDIPEATVAFLSCAAIGAVWASCGQDYSPTAAASRFAQLDPVVLVTADGYRYGGRERDRLGAAQTLLHDLPTVRAAVVVSRLGSDRPSSWYRWRDTVAEPAELTVSPVPFDHPLWVLFSSGTTGRPKGIVHGHGGVLLEHLKALGLHQDVRAGDRVAWYTTPSWMVWNYRVSALLLGAASVSYDGSPVTPSPDVLWSLAARQRITFLGVSPGFLAASRAAGIEPAARHDLRALRAIGSSGAHLPASAYSWIAEHVGEQISVQSASGGTEVVSAFAGGVPTLPIRPGEMTARSLGVAMESWGPDGKAVRGEPGELVITRPMPSMPLYFWEDPGYERYRDAYFVAEPDVWRHGDWTTITDAGSVIVHGRSDSTLNRNGVRMGSADIYQAVEAIPEIHEALVIGAEQLDGSYWMPLFVHLVDGVVLSDELAERITAAIRDGASPRHVPDDIVTIAAIPHTRTGKKLEVPVKRILQGADAGQAADSGAVDDFAALRVFAEYRTTRAARSRASTPAT